MGPSEIATLARAAYASGKCVPATHLFFMDSVEELPKCCGLTAACIEKVGFKKFREAVDNREGFDFADVIDSILETPRETRLGFQSGFDIMPEEFEDVLYNKQSAWITAAKVAQTLRLEVLKPDTRLA